MKCKYCEVKQYMLKLLPIILIINLKGRSKLCDAFKGTRNTPDICIIPGCMHFNDDPGQTNLCGCHIVELQKIIKKLGSKNHPRFTHRRLNKIIETLSQEEIIKLMSERHLPIEEIEKTKLSVNKCVEHLIQKIKNHEKGVIVVVGDSDHIFEENLIKPLIQLNSKGYQIKNFCMVTPKGMEKFENIEAATVYPFFFSNLKWRGSQRERVLRSLLKVGKKLLIIIPTFLSEIDKTRAWIYDAGLKLKDFEWIYLAKAHA